MVGIRGATTINNDTEEDIMNCTTELLEKAISYNSLDRELIKAVFFSCTKDITSAYPAKAAREIGFTEIPLMCFQEMHVDGSLQKCIRLCIFYEGEISPKDIKHVYLKEAKHLRPDLANAK